MKKRALALILTAIMLIACVSFLAACGDKAPQEELPEQSATGGETPGTPAPTDPTPSEPIANLTFGLNSDGNSYIVTGCLGSTTDVVVPATYNDLPVNTIGVSAFSGLRNLTSITLPASVKDIGAFAFNNCTSLSKVLYQGTAADWCGITFRASSANPLAYAHDLYINGEKATEITIPDGVTALGNYQFYGWSGTKVTLSSSVANIGVETFKACDSLVYKEDGAGRYLGSADNDYFALMHVVLGTDTSCAVHDNCVMIYEDAFAEYTRLESVTLPVSIIRIDDRSFYNCSNLTAVNFGGTIAEWQAVSTGSNWNYGTPSYIVHCTNGTIGKFGTVTYN